MTHRLSLPAKFSAPRLPAVARRERLVRRMDAARDLPCAWICGPGGCGKTTLAADYLRTIPGTHLWFNVDEGDADPSTAIAGLVMLTRLAFGEHIELPYFTADHNANPARFHRLFFRAFYENLGEGGAVVLDSCERASSDDFALLLRAAIEEVPPGVRLLVLSRHRLPEALIKAHADRRVAVLGAEDLRLDLAESGAVASAIRGAPIADVEALHRLSDGWAAGLVLMLSASEGPVATRGASALDLPSREAVFGYFASEFFDAAEPPLRDLMLRTCLLPWVDPPQAAALTGNPAAGALLDRLYRRHLFHVRRDGVAPGVPAVYAYHDLFRAFLLARLDTAFDAGELGRLRTRVASLLEAAGLASEALAQWRLAGSWDDVVRLIRTEAHRLVDHGQFRTLGEWLEGIPRERMDEDPWLIYFRGQLTAGTAPGEAIALIRMAHEKFQAVQDIPGQFTAAFAQMQLVSATSSNYKSWDRWIDVLGHLLEIHPPDQPALAVRAWHSFLYVCFFRRPHHPLIATAVANLDRALFSGRLPPAQAIQAAHGLIAYAHFACDTALAERTLPILASCVKNEQIGLLSRLMAATWTNVYYFFSARYRDALHWLGVAIPLAEEGGFKTIAQLLHRYRVQSLLYVGDRELAVQEATRLQRQPKGPMDEYPAAYAATSEALMHFATGDIASAVSVGEQGLDAWERNGFGLARLGWAMSTQAVYRMAAGDVEGSLALVAEAEAGLAGTVCNYPCSLHALLRAHAALLRGDRPGALRQLEVCFEAATNRKRMGVLHWARPMLPPLLSLAWEHGIAREPIAGLVEEWSLTPPSPGTLHWPHPVALRLLGQFEMLRYGTPVSFGRKPPRKLLALLQAIAVNGERGLGLEVAREMLWADQDGDAAAMSQTAALHRLRKLIGVPSAIQLTDGRLWLDPAVVWIDTVAFERLADSEDPKAQQAALDLYRGTLLPHGEDAAWCLSARHRMLDRFVRLIDRLASGLESKDIEAAQALYRQGIDAEPLVESNYQGLMRCCAARSEPAEAVAVYRRLERTLAVAAGLRPSPASQRLLQTCLEAAADPVFRAGGSPPSDRTSTVPPPDSRGHNGKSIRR